ncbi:hypothetical protein RRF57_003822 [Xylaria bambusicola]|uniref:Uncharacterized protein n=1 Tax=Xylaria bambusicola TaxID=326684 RepID=A0AAN7UH12_9PEZI
MATSQPAGIVFNPALKRIPLSAPVRAMLNEYALVSCSVFRGQDTEYQGIDIKAPLGPKALLFILKPEEGRVAPRIKKRKLAEPKTNKKMEEPPRKKRKADVETNVKELEEPPKKQCNGRR